MAHEIDDIRAWLELAAKLADHALNSGPSIRGSATAQAVRSLHDAIFCVEAARTRDFRISVEDERELWHAKERVQHSFLRLLLSLDTMHRTTLVHQLATIQRAELN